MKACAYRGSTSQAKYSGTNCGNTSIQTANQAAAAAPSTPQATCVRGGQVIRRSPVDIDRETGRIEQPFLRLTEQTGLADPPGDPDLQPLRALGNQQGLEQGLVTGDLL